MKTKIKKIFFALCTVLIVSALVKATLIINSAVVDEPSLAYSKNVDVNLNSYGINRLSVQAAYSSATIAAVDFIDGTVSTATITVSNNEVLAVGYSSNTITISSNSALTGAIITINAKQYREGYEWTKMSLASHTAISLATALNGSIYGMTASTTAAAVVTMVFSVQGETYNSYTLASSTPTAMAAGSANFAGGRSPASIRINTVTLTNGYDWNTGADEDATAKSISDAIANNATLSAVISSTWSSTGIVELTSKYMGTIRNYAMYSSTQSAIVLSGNVSLYGGAGTSAMEGGTTSNIVTAQNKISVANFLTTGLPVLYTENAGTSPGSLVAGTTYFAIGIDAANFKLSATSTGAVAGVNVLINTQTQAGAGSFTLTPLGYSGTCGIEFQVSNDNVSWDNLPSVSSVTIASPGTAGTAYRDLGEINPKYLRFKVTSPTTGGLNLKITINAKS